MRCVAYMKLRITPVILAGGTGERLWPMSRRSMPKQFLGFPPGDGSTFQTALRRVSSEMFEAPLVMTREEYRWIATEQIRAMGCHAEMVLEPADCGTALSVAVAARIIEKRRNGSLCLILASDQVSENQHQFEQDCRMAAECASQAHIVLFGIAPDNPNPNYGYIETGERISPGDGYRIKRFIEKPDPNHAETLIEAGCLWNSGNVLFDPAVMIDELEDIIPELASAAENAWDNADDDGDASILPRNAGQGLNAVSIDYAVLEKTSRAAVVRASFGWSDIGSWQSIYNLGAKDAAGNVEAGKVYSLDTRNSFIFSDGPVTAVIGLNDVAVIATSNALLVSTLNQSSRVKEIAASLASAGRAGLSAETRTGRPWGWFERLGSGANFQVKQIVVKPGAALSLQMHHHRDEHWTVVQGIGEITIGLETNTFPAGSNVYIPKETIHRLRNVADSDLIVIEVQTGSYLGEDDIIRFEDIYRRT